MFKKIGLATVLSFLFPLVAKAQDSKLTILECGWNPSAPYYNDVNCLIMQAVKVGEFVFSIIGAAAFVMFVYGGFTLILSMGSSEKVKKGKDIMVAAVIGLIIAFSAYILINFILDAFGVGGSFRG